jgi:hypothetical protein
MIKISAFLIRISIAPSLPHLAHAQMPADVAAQVKAMGRVINPPATAVFYAPRVQDKEPFAGVSAQRDIAYGADASICWMSSRQRRHPACRARYLSLYTAADLHAAIGEPRAVRFMTT